VEVRFGETPKVRAGLALHARRARYPVVFKNVVDFHDVDLMSNATRIAISKHRNLSSSLS